MSPSSEPLPGKQQHLPGHLQALYQVCRSAFLACGCSVPLYCSMLLLCLVDDTERKAKVTHPDMWAVAQLLSSQLQPIWISQLGAVGFTTEMGVGAQQQVGGQQQEVAVKGGAAACIELMNGLAPLLCGSSTTNSTTTSSPVGLPASGLQDARLSWLGGALATMCLFMSQHVGPYWPAKLQPQAYQLAAQALAMATAMSSPAATATAAMHQDSAGSPGSTTTHQGSHQVAAVNHHQQHHQYQYQYHRATTELCQCYHKEVGGGPATGGGGGGGARARWPVALVHGGLQAAAALRDRSTGGWMGGCMGGCQVGAHKLGVRAWWSTAPC